MSKRRHPEDAGMLAVRRVRSVREQDSLVGLQRAVAERRAAGSRLAALRQTAARQQQFDVGDMAAFFSARTAMAALTAQISAAEEAWSASTLLLDTANARWQQDRARLEAIDLLLRRREQTRAAEARRREAQVLDEAAAQRWLRDREEAR